MRRAFLYGLGTLLIVGIFGSLATFDAEAFVLALSLIPVSVVVIAAANRAPPNRSLPQAILGWLLGSFAFAAVGVAVIGVLRLAAWLRRAGLIGTDFWSVISILWLGLLVLGWIVYWIRVRGSRFARRRQKDWKENKAFREQARGKQREWWEVLEVDPKAGPDDIRRAYLRKMRMYHPDRVTGLAAELIELSESRTRELNLAFEESKRIAMNNRG